MVRIFLMSRERLTHKHSQQNRILLNTSRLPAASELVVRWAGITKGIRKEWETAEVFILRDGKEKSIIHMACWPNTNRRHYFYYSFLRGYQFECRFRYKNRKGLLLRSQQINPSFMWVTPLSYRFRFLIRYKMI